MRNILFFSPPFFNYPSIIYKELCKNFDKVSYFNTVPATWIYKLMWYLENYFHIAFFKNKCINNLFCSIKKDIEKDDVVYDTILVIKGTCIPIEFYSFLKKKYPHAKYIQYLWDDICNDPDASTTFKYFDIVYSYNEWDCKEYGLEFRPFFYSEDFLSNLQDRKYDLSCIMSFSEDRIILLNNFFNNIKPPLSSFILIKASWLLKLLNKSKLGKLEKYITSKGVDYATMMDILKHSKCQIDIQHPRQKGLTTRAFEALATRTKLITTNSNIKYYDFYNPRNIAVISREDPTVEVNWIDLPYEPIPDDILNKYSLTSFLKDILDI